MPKCPLLSAAMASNSSIGTARRISTPAAARPLVKREAMARGLMVYPMGGTIDGANGDHVLLAPPFIVNKVQIDTIVERLGDAVDAAVASVK